MGIRLTADHSSYVFYMGYGGFFSLRKNIALALDREFGEHYAELIYCHTPADFDAHDRRAGRGFRYAAERRNDYEELKLFLRECRSTRRKVRWN